VWSIVSGALPAGVALGVVDGTNIGVIVVRRPKLVRTP
jgi:hypothetical protein